jgi:hypothetical protein
LLKLLALCHVVLPLFPSMSVWSQYDAIKSCPIYHKDKNGCFMLDKIGSDLSKMDQTWPNWISRQSTHSFICLNSLVQIRSNQTKLDQIGSNWIKKDQDGSGWLFGSHQIKLVQIGSNWFKLVQIGSNWFKLVLLGSNWFKSDQSELNEIVIGPNLIKSDVIFSFLSISCFDRLVF